MYSAPVLLFIALCTASADTVSAIQNAVAPPFTVRLRS